MARCLPRAQQRAAVQDVGLNVIRHPLSHPPGLRMAFLCQAVFTIGQQQALIIVRTELLRVANQVDVRHN